MGSKFKLATLRVKGLCPRMVPGEEFEEFLGEGFLLCSLQVGYVEPFASLGRDEGV